MQERLGSPTFISSQNIMRPISDFSKHCSCPVIDAKPCNWPPTEILVSVLWPEELSSSEKKAPAKQRNKEVNISSLALPIQKHWENGCQQRQESKEWEGGCITIKQWEWVSGLVWSLPNIAAWVLTGTRGDRQEAVAHRITLLYGSCLGDISLSQTSYLGPAWVAFSLPWITWIWNNITCIDAAQLIPFYM